MLFEQNTPTKYLNTREAASFLSLSPRTLEKHRTFGTGPLFRKLGGRIAYKVEELQSWADRGTRASTSDPGFDTVLPARHHDTREIEIMEHARKLSGRVPKKSNSRRISKKSKT